MLPPALRAILNSLFPPQPKTPVYDYSRELSEEEIQEGRHRKVIGGLWEELGAYQLSLLKSEGLLNKHQVLDLGCGALRGGIPIAHYLTKGRYVGIDGNQSLLDAGQMEADKAEVPAERIELHCSSRFELPSEHYTFDFILAFSLFTHFTEAQVKQALAIIRPYFEAHTRLIATFFFAPEDHSLSRPYTQPPEGIITNSEHDPYHLHLSELSDWCSQHGYLVSPLACSPHPRGQRVVRITLAP